MIKEIVLVRGHHLRLLYRFVYENSEKSLLETGLKDHGAKFAKNSIEVFKKIRDGVVNVKLIDGIDSVCKFCEKRKTKTCKDFLPCDTSTACEDRGWLRLFKFQRNRTYTSSFILKKIRSKFKKQSYC